MMKKKGYSKGGMKKKGYANGGKMMKPADIILLTADICVRGELTKLGCVCPTLNLGM